ncbi:LOW QUALITY PROTEIN: hypothetical protein YC2023_117532 [Brassica napus]
MDPIDKDPDPDNLKLSGYPIHLARIAVERLLNGVSHLLEEGKRHRLFRCLIYWKRINGTVLSRRSLMSWVKSTEKKTN